MGSLFTLTLWFVIWAKLVAKPGTPLQYQTKIQIRILFNTKDTEKVTYNYSIIILTATGGGSVQQLVRQLSTAPDQATVQKPIYQATETQEHSDLLLGSAENHLKHSQNSAKYLLNIIQEGCCYKPY